MNLMTHESKMKSGGRSQNAHTDKTCIAQHADDLAAVIDSIFNRLYTVCLHVAAAFCVA